ncbi:hypothetical protein [Kocuria tytonicola]|uniref:hypothetical protein n=1 Tax=Kocuria tytonicola TaxID=2055946 RepID=UPI001F0C363C|nr:hypothetical protein [Kocuria tytonicola]
MSQYPHDEFDDVPEDGARQGAHRGHNPRARTGSRRELRAVVAAGVTSLVIGAVCFVNSPRTAQEPQAAAASPVFSVPSAGPDAAWAGASQRCAGGVVPA